MKRIFVLALCSVGCFFGTSAQSVRENILRMVLENNPTLKSVRLTNEAAYWESRSGITLSNPEVEFGYQSDFANDGSYKRQLNLSQEIDFSVVSGRKKRLAVAQNALNEKEYQKSSKEVEGEILQLLDRMVYLRKKRDMYIQRIDNSKQIVDLYERSWKNGDCSKLNYNRARLSLADVVASYQTNYLELNSAYMRLTTANGGAAIDTAGLGYDETTLPLEFDSWFASVVDSLPDVQASMQQHTLYEAEKKLAQSYWWPKLTAGYQSERTNDENFHGLNVGLSLPLWENRNSVKAAKLKVSAAEAQTNIRKQSQHDAIYQLYSQARELEKLYATYGESLSNILEMKALLQKAVEAGEMSLTDYLVEVSTYYDLTEKLLDAEYQYQQSKTALVIYEKF